jgi:hypothetical protein
MSGPRHRFQRHWSGRRDSNPRPQPWQGCALPLSYTRILTGSGPCRPRSYAKWASGKQPMQEAVASQLRGVSDVARPEPAHSC